MDLKFVLPVTWNEFLVTHSQDSVSWKEHRLLISNRSLLILFHHLLTTCQNEDKTESLSNPTTDSITSQFFPSRILKLGLLFLVFWFLPGCTPRYQWDSSRATFKIVDIVVKFVCCQQEPNKHNLILVARIYPYFIH